MSWNKTQFKKAYNRADTKHELLVAEDEEFRDLQDDYFAEMQREYDDPTPSMDEIITGKLLFMLVRLNIRGTKAILDEWYW